MTYIRRLLYCLFAAGMVSQSMAIEPQAIPDLLKPWVPWVLDGQTSKSCPFFYSDFQQKHCRWPGTTNLDLHDTRGTFDSEWILYQNDWIELPGDSQHWPQQVIINRNPAVVLQRNDKPAIWMPAGRYQISGEFLWDKLPESLPLSSDTGLIKLKLNDIALPHPRIDRGAIWLNLKPYSVSENQQDSLDLQVFREIIDENPFQVSTRLELNVAGKAREIALPYALLANFIPIRLDSPLPAKLEANGSLLVQVRPGRWQITLHARHTLPMEELNFAVQDSDWPTAELWVFQAVPALRLVEIEGLQSVDSSQTNLPADWQHLPAYKIKQGESMRFKVIRHGDPEPEPNQLHLQRKLWLDFDGQGYTVSDQINGKMTQGWRLDALPETQLGQAVLNGQNQLITQFGELKGVEVRRGTIQLQADSRIENTITDLNAVGWLQSFQSVAAELNIPPGWRLLAVSGVDNDPDCWITRWTLLDLFLVLIATLAIARLWSWHWGLLALLAMALIWHEAGAPRWIWLNTLAAIALLRILPDNRFAHWIAWYRNLCWLALVMIVIPFMVAQIRIGIYPQLEKPWQPISVTPYADSFGSGNEMAEADMMMEKPAPSVAPQAARSLAKLYSPPPEPAKAASHFDRIDPDANLQTGPGLPQWQWQRVQLAWNGSVNDRQQIKLWYLSPGWSLLFHIVQALLAAVLAMRLMGLIMPRFRIAWPNLSACVLIPLLMAPSDNGFADIPDQDLLDQLQAKLLQAPECLPACANIPSMAISIGGDEMRIRLIVHAQQPVAVPLPAQLQQWFPQQVNLDGQTAHTLLRQHDGQLWIVLDAGVHQVDMQGPHSTQYKFNLPLPLQPGYTTVTSDGWRIDGLYENGKVGAQLEFSRLHAESGPQSAELQQSAMPAFVRIERTLQLGLDWRLVTRAVKLAGNDSPVVLELPLLPGENVTSGHMRIKGGKVLINMPAGQDSLEWQSLLEKRPQLELTAPANAPWSELWRADVSPIWHLEASGIAVVHHQDQQGAWLPEWRPWPGETVSLQITRPAAVPGPTLTVDKSELLLQPGKRTRSASLTLELRSSKGGQHTIALPAEAVLQNVLIDGSSQPIRQQQHTVTLPIKPGPQQIELSWLTDEAETTVLATPIIDLGVASVNSHIRLILGSDRWVLLPLGPKFGPAALIWGLLPVLLVLAWGLGRAELTPLKFRHWLLLLIGLSQIHIAGGMLVVGWLFALGLRAKTGPAKVRYFNALQVGVALLTLSALALLFAAVQQGLLGMPDMQITGNQSDAHNLNWYQDRSGSLLPTASVVSLPLIDYRLAMLAWSLWLALSLLQWLRWAWLCFATEGLWAKKNPTPATGDTGETSK